MALLTGAAEKTLQSSCTFMFGVLPPEVEEGSVALLPKLLVLLALHASHPLHHLFAQLHGRRQRFGVSAEDVAKVDVEELSCKKRNTLKLFH